MPQLTFALPDDESVTVEVNTLLNAGYAGRSQADVTAHITELAELVCPHPPASRASTRSPPTWRCRPMRSTSSMSSPRARRNGRWWSPAPDPTICCSPQRVTTPIDASNNMGLPRSKQAAPDVLAGRAWRLATIADRLDEFTLTGTVETETGIEVIQQGTLTELLSPLFWVEELRSRDLLKPGTVLMSGTIPMRPHVNQFSTGWGVELRDPVTSEAISTVLLSAADAPGSRLRRP